MPTLQVTEEQLRLIQRSLDMYSRIGIGQMWVIKDHPTFENVLSDKLRPKKQLEVGDQTERGEIVEIGGGYIKTKGSWGNGQEVKTWTDVEKVKLSIDYSQYHSIRDMGEKILNQGRNMLLQEELSNNSSYGIHNPNVDESCRVAFDILQVIRHELWNIQHEDDKVHYIVASSIHLTTKDSNKIKCKI